MLLAQHKHQHGVEWSIVMSDKVLGLVCANRSITAQVPLVLVYVKPASMSAIGCKRPDAPNINHQTSNTKLGGFVRAKGDNTKKPAAAAVVVALSEAVSARSPFHTFCSR